MYRLLFYNGSLKEQVPQKSIQVWYSRTQKIYTLRLRVLDPNRKAKTLHPKSEILSAYLSAETLNRKY